MCVCVCVCVCVCEAIMKREEGWISGLSERPSQSRVRFACVCVCVCVRLS